MNQLIFIIIISLILIFYKIYYFKENFINENNNNTTNGIYNSFYQQILNPYKYNMTPFFSNDSNKNIKQDLHKNKI